MAKASETGNPEKLNRIVEGTVIEGEIKSESNIRIDGIVKGVTTTQGRLVIGPNGVIEGEVICRNADIEGTLNGKITVSELLSLKSTSKLTGDIISRRLAIEPGAVFTGTCTMGAKVKTLLAVRKTTLTQSRSLQEQSNSGDDSEKRKLNSRFAKYTGSSFKVAAVILLFYYAGNWVDGQLALDRPWFAMFGSLVGVAAGIYSLIKDLTS